MKLIVVGGILACAIVLSACAHTEPPPTAVASDNIPPPAPPPPPPKKQWYKQGATAEEFQRTRARCIMNAESAASTLDTRWGVIFLSCMRSEGWVSQ
jgi:hypothetical protein